VSDRTVHAACGEWQVVRYDRAGKWYVEYDPPRMRPAQRVSVKQAARLAVKMHREAAGHFYLDRPGGATFDRLVDDLINAQAGAEDPVPLKEAREASD
jgi:hypothetical protein